LSHGSANDSAKLLKKCNDYILDDSIKLHWGTTLQENSLDRFSYNFPNIDCEEFSQLLGVRYVKKKSKGLQISGKNEAGLQSWISSHLNALDALDTHSSIQDAIEFLPPREFSNSSVLYTNTGIADLTSLFRRQILEVKSHGNEDSLMMQMLDRVKSSLDMSYMLLNAVAFGATPTLRFIVIGTRHLPEHRSDSTYLSLHLFKVDNTDFIPLWQLAKGCDPMTYLTPDAPLIYHGLRAMGCDPWLCRIHLSDRSQSAVYDITLPVKHNWPRSVDRRPDEEAVSTCTAVKCGNPSFAMKIIHDSTAFEREASALSHVKPDYFKCGVSSSNQMFPGHRKMTFDKDMKTLFTIRANAIRNRSGWWTRVPPPRGGGCLFMQFGEALSSSHELDVSTRITIFNDVMESLSRLHARDYYHTDIRLPNILKCEDRYTLIDFGEVIQKGDRVCLDTFSEDRRNLVSVVPGGVSMVLWDRAHEVEMLTRCVFDIPVMPLKKRRRDVIARSDIPANIKRGRKI
jgi:hypothetical protein